MRKFLVFQNFQQWNTRKQMKKHLLNVLPQAEEERMKRLVKLTARLVDKMLSTTVAAVGQARSHSDEQ